MPPRLGMPKGFLLSLTGVLSCLLMAALMGPLLMLALRTGPLMLLRPFTGLPWMLVGTALAFMLGPGTLLLRLWLWLWTPFPLMERGRPFGIPFCMLLSRPALMGPPTGGPIPALSLLSPMLSTSGQKRSSSQHICRKISSQRDISSLPSRVVVMFASSSTSARVASTNLLKAGDVQFGMRAWWRATMCESLEVLERVLEKEEAYCQAER
jgi:hypothetical protein